MKKIKALALLSLFAQFDVFAGYDMKIFNGSLCKAVNAADENSLSRSYSKLTNLSTSKNITVTCPIVKDKTNEDTINYARMTIRTPNGQTTCKTMVTKQVGIAQEIASTIIGQNSAIQERVLYDVDGNENLSAYNIECQLAPKGEILNYKFGE